jgi:hypothetical protein
MHRHPSNASVVDEYVARVRLDEAGDHPQRCRFAAAARPQQPHVAGRDRQAVNGARAAWLFLQRIYSQPDLPSTS